jgi:hypothetical protein
MGKKDPNEILRERYKKLRKAGVSVPLAKKYRKYTDETIQNVIDMVNAGMGEQLSVPDYYKPKRQPKKEEPKKQPGKRKKDPPRQAPQEPPPGYHYAYYKKSGKFVLRKNPTRKKSGGGVVKERIIEFPRLMVFMKDQTDRIDNGEYLKTFAYNLGKTIGELKEEIKEQLYEDGGAIGRTKIFVVSGEKERESYLREYSNWALIYDDVPTYKDMLAVIDSISTGNYEGWRKQAYKEELIFSVEEINPKIFQRLNNDRI